ncbi:MAG: polysaccharide export protein [Alphaproteobacteria bacterium]|nr:polysaccharide export protein [Alphaproteobacteria bacterium]
MAGHAWADNVPRRPAPPLPAASSEQAVNPVLPPISGSIQEYVLGVGDRFRLTVYGEEDLSGEYEVNSTGQAALPLIGNMPAAGQTVHSFEQAVRDKLSAGYLHDPRVSVQVSNYRPFFILGEVSKPGSYPYVNGMTVLNAVAMAGGYTYRADKSDAVVIHANDANKMEQPIREEDTVKPGDIIRVPERFF